MELLKKISVAIWYFTWIAVSVIVFAGLRNLIAESYEISKITMINIFFWLISLSFIISTLLFTKKIKETNFIAYFFMFAGVLLIIQLTWGYAAAEGNSNVVRISLWVLYNLSLILFSLATVGLPINFLLSKVKKIK